MSDTRRLSDQERLWGPYHQTLSYPRRSGDQPESLKHQQRDRSVKLGFWRKHRFVKGLLNSRYNLKRKNEKLAEKEHHDKEIA